MKDVDNFNLNEFHKRIGNNVKRIRQEKGISQLALSQAIGHKSVSVISYAEIYHKNYHFNLEHLGKISFVLDIDISEFFK
jgi:transcriptional regulator with XRE-family HTH domain